jgi:hypothetical protein
MNIVPMETFFDGQTYRQNEAIKRSRNFASLKSTVLGIHHSDTEMKYSTIKVPERTVRLLLYFSDKSYISFN